MNLNRIRNIDRDDQGAALVEFALVAPVLLMLVAGIFYFGLAWTSSTQLNGAVNDAARVALIPGSTVADVTTAFNRTKPAGATISGITICTTTPGAPANATATATYVATFSIPFVPMPDKTITAKASLRC